MEDNAVKMSVLHEELNTNFRIWGRFYEAEGFCYDTSIAEIWSPKGWKNPRKNSFQKGEKNLGKILKKHVDKPKIMW